MLEGAPGGLWGGLGGPKASPRGSWGTPWGARGRPWGALGGPWGSLGGPRGVLRGHFWQTDGFAKSLVLLYKMVHFGSRKGPWGNQGGRVGARTPRKATLPHKTIAESARTHPLHESTSRRKSAPPRIKYVPPRKATRHVTQSAVRITPFEARLAAVGCSAHGRCRRRPTPAVWPCR